MPSYHFSALCDDGLIVKDRMDAANVVRLRELLQHESKTLLHCSTTFSLLTTDRVSRGERLELIKQFCDSLQMLLSTGVTLADALDVMGYSESERLSTICERILRRLSAGMKFSHCLQAEGTLFDDLHIRILSLGEKTGTLGEALEEMSRAISWETDLRTKTRECLSYPVLAFISTLLMCVFLMVQVVPVIREFVESVGNELPWYTIGLFAVSSFLGDWWFYLFLSAISILMILTLLTYSVPGFLLLIHKLSLSICVVGPIVNQLLLAEFAHHMALLYRTNLSLPDCLEGCRQVIRNQYVEKGIALATQRVSAGDTLTVSLKRAGVFPEFVLQTIAIGEISGSLDQVFNNLAELYRCKANVRIRRLQALVGPIVMVFLGFIVLWIVVSLFAPLYESVTALSGGY